MTQTNDWQPISIAPRDGTWVEIRCTYGIAPWYDVFRWTTHVTSLGPSGLTQYEADSPRWDNGRAGSVDDGPTIMWRPYTGDPTTYVDPTDGAQNTAQYWRNAVTEKYGLPKGYLDPPVWKVAWRAVESWVWRNFRWYRRFRMRKSVVWTVEGFPR